MENSLDIPDVFPEKLTIGDMKYSQIKISSSIKQGENDQYEIFLSEKSGKKIIGFSVYPVI